MILLDANVVSELMRPNPNPAVTAFIQKHRLGDLFLPSLCEAEIRYGLDRLPRGRRRVELEAAFVTFMRQGFRDRVVAFDSACASAYAKARAERERAGRPGSLTDMLIAGMALAHGASLATRNIADFDGCGLTILDPWSQA